MPEMNLRQTRFTCSACVPYITNKERIQRFKETKDLRYLSKGTRQRLFSTQHGLWRFYGFTTKIAFGKVLRDKTFIVAKNPKHD